MKRYFLICLLCVMSLCSCTQNLIEISEPVESNVILSKIDDYQEGYVISYAFKVPMNKELWKYGESNVQIIENEANDFLEIGYEGTSFDKTCEVNAETLRKENEYNHIFCTTISSDNIKNIKEAKITIEYYDEMKNVIARKSFQPFLSVEDLVK